MKACLQNHFCEKLEKLFPLRKSHLSSALGVEFLENCFWVHEGRWDLVSIYEALDVRALEIVHSVDVDRFEGQHYVEALLVDDFVELLLELLEALNLEQHKLCYLKLQFKWEFSRVLSILGRVEGSLFVEVLRIDSVYK